MKKKKQLLYSLVLVLLISVGGCMTTKTNIGLYKETEGNVSKYSKGRQLWVFWGTVSVGKTRLETPSTGSCQIVTRQNLKDIAISIVTAGFVKSQTIKVNIKK